MAYQVRSGTLTIVVPTTVAALKVRDRLVESGNVGVTVHDMDGREIDDDTLRSAMADE